MDIKTGHLYWKFKTQDIVKSSPTCVQYCITNDTDDYLGNDESSCDESTDKNGYLREINDQATYFTEDSPEDVCRSRLYNNVDGQTKETVVTESSGSNQITSSFINNQKASSSSDSSGNNINNSSPLSTLHITFIACHDKYLYAFNHTTKTLLWKYNTKGLCNSTPLVTQTVPVAMFNFSSNSFVNDDKNRKMSYPINNTTNINSSSSSSDTFNKSHSQHLVYVTLLTGKVLAVDQLSGCLMWQFNAGKPVFTSPSFLRRNGHELSVVFGCVDGCLYCVDAMCGQLVWKYKTDGPIFSSPTIVPVTEEDCCGEIVSSEVCHTSFSCNDYQQQQQQQQQQQHFHKQDNISYCCFGSNDGFVHTIDQHGSLLWKARIGVPVVASPAIINPKVLQFTKSTMTSSHMVFCIDTKGGFHLFNLVTGEPINLCGGGDGKNKEQGGGVTRCAGEVFSSPVAVGGDTIVFGSRDNHVYFLKVT